MAHQMEGSNTDQRTPVMRYVSIMEPQDPEELGEALIQMFYAILTQIITRIARIDPKSTGWRDEFNSSLKFLHPILDSKISLVRKKDFADIFSGVIRLPASNSRVKETLSSIFKHRFTGQEGSSLQMKAISRYTELMERSDLTEEHQVVAMQSFYVVLHDLDPPLSALDTGDQECLTEIDHPGLALIISLYLPPERVFPVLANPFNERWDDFYGKELLQRWVWRMVGSTISDSQSSFLRSIILGTSQDLCSLAVELLEDTFNVTEQTWKRLITPEVITKIMQHYLRLFEETRDFSFPLLLKISHFEWFTDSLMSSDISWINKAVSRVRSRDLSDVSLLFMDQIVFSRSMEHLQFWLECARSSLQGIRCRYSTTSTEDRHGWPNSLVGPGGYIHSLREVLLWVLKKSDVARFSVGGRGRQGGLNNDALDLEKIATESRKDARNKELNQVYMMPQSFQFLSQLSEQDREEWNTFVRVVLMGCSLSIGMGTAAVSIRYARDPEGVCNHTENGASNRDLDLSSGVFTI
ncbi:hypothetical protein CPB86DRAFT_620969 [Serendipita vermifera]|nr:hypothetical protein CPB86DRAFT_620969 [Serendipita vermifera]